jgi:anti-anti-sigma factor
MKNEPEAPLNVRTVVGGDNVTIISAEGEIDLTTSAGLERHLTEAAVGRAPIILDLTEIRYIDSSGFRTLQRAAGECTLILVVPPEAFAHRAVELAGLGQVLTICDDVAGARQRIAGG